MNHDENNTIKFSANTRCKTSERTEVPIVIITSHVIIEEKKLMKIQAREYGIE
jgi:hypothetical protein